MKTILVLSTLLVAAYAAPQGYNYQSQTRVDSSGVTINCERQEVAPGRFQFSCSQGNPGIITEEKTLWVPTSGQDQELLIRIPNYNFREIIRAGLRGGAAGGTNVRVHVARPQVESVVEGHFEQRGALAPNVQVSYDAVQNQPEVHYGGGGQPYRSLSKAIAEPGSRYKKEA